MIDSETKEVIDNLLSIIGDLTDTVKSNSAALQEHMNTDFTKAHVRNGHWEEVLQYLGLDVEEDVVTVPLVPKDTTQEATAESVL